MDEIIVSMLLQMHFERLRAAAQQTKSKQLQSAIQAAVGFHNAALEPEDRELVERLFLGHDISVRAQTPVWLYLCLYL